MMKKVLNCMLALASIALVGCSEEKPYSITCHFPSSKTDSTYAYLVTFNSGLRDVNYIDSALIENGRAVFVGTTQGSEVCGIYTAPRKRILFIKEAGDIKIEGTELIIGTKLNDEWLDYRSYSDSVNNSAAELYNIAAKNPELTEEERSAQIDEIITDYSTKILNKASDVLATHKKDALGQLVFWMDIANNEIMDRHAYKQKLAEAGEYIAEYGPIKAITARFEAQESTSEGKMFTDFTIEHGNLDGTEAKLSDYVGKGKVVLVDFWASWCGPCRRAMPKIAEAYKTFPSEKFQVLSVAVWDKHDDTLEAIEKLGMEWNNIIDADTAPTNLYGVNGIPHLMLIDADGTILRRGVAPDNIITAVNEALSK